MILQISEAVVGGDPEIVLNLLERHLIRVSRQVVLREQTVSARDIRISLSSLLQTSTVVVVVRANDTSCLLTAHVTCRPSFAFWFLTGVGLLTAFGWLIPIALYLSQKGAIRSTVADVVHRVKTECEFIASSTAEEVQLARGDAENGSAEAQVRLADAYYEGDGVPQSLTEAAHWYQKAAEQGDIVAQVNLGSAYCAGEGVPQDYAEGARWFRMAAEQGDEAALSNLKVLRERGQA